MNKNFHQRTIFIAGILLLAMSLLFINIPLLNYLGYEFSTAIALIVPWILWFPTSLSFREWMKEQETGSSRGFLSLVTSCVFTGFGLLLIPLIVGGMNVFFVKNCAIAEGVLYYLLLPLVTAFWSIALSIICCVLARRPFRLYAAILVLTLLYPFYIGYVSPQIYSYNFIYGFFPGISYDEIVRITPTLISFRCVTIAMAFLFVLMASLVIRQSSPDRKFHEKIMSLFSPLQPKTTQLSAMLLLIGLMVVWVIRVPLGFETSEGSIRKTLSSHIQTEHFTIYYAPASFSHDEIQWVAALHEFRYEQVCNALHVTTPISITSYIYPDEETKHEAIGTSTTNIAKPWRKEIHLDFHSWQETLKHEIVHVVAGEFGMPIIKAHYHIGLVEGLAMAIDGEYGNRTLHEYAAAIKIFHLIHNPGSLITPIGFATHGSSLSYVLMGSFCRYLLDRYGVVRFKELYGGNSVEKVYGTSYQGLVDEWQSFLDRIIIPGSWKDHVEFYFNRPSIFAKECVRTVAILNEEANRKFAHRDMDGAIHDFKQALMTNWNTESYAGILRSSYAAGYFDTVVSLFDTVNQDSSTHPTFLGFLLAYGDAEWHEGNENSAADAYRQILHIDLSRSVDEAAAVRLEAMEDPVVGPIFPRYLSIAQSDTASLKFLDSCSRQMNSPFLRFLEARAGLRLEKFQQVIDLLQRDSMRFSRPELNASKELMLGQASLRLLQFQNARAHFWRSLNFMNNLAVMQQVYDSIERCEWYEQHERQYFGFKK